MSKTILVTGATGNIAGLIIPQLIEAGMNVRAYVRDPEKATSLKEQGIEIFHGDYDNQEALNAAAENIDAIVAITPPNPDAVKQGEAILKAALNSGSPFYLRISAIGAATDAPTENGRFHFESDQALINSGLNYTILRPHFFMQNLFGNVEGIKGQGNLYMGMGEGKMGMVDVRDVADVAVNILLNRGHDGQIYTLTGPESITFSDVASTISNSINKPVNYIPVGLEDVRQSILDMGWGEWGAQLMVDYSKAYSENWGDFTTDSVKEITGKESRSIDEFVNETLTYALQ